MEAELYTFFISALDGGSIQLYYHSLYFPRKRPGTHWAGLKNGLDPMENAPALTADRTPIDQQVKSSLHRINYPTTPFNSNSHYPTSLMLHGNS